MKFAVIIALILVAAVFYSFAINLFGDTPSVSLVDSTAGVGHDSSVGEHTGSLRPVEVTPATVQSAVATLNRYGSYRRTVVIEYLKAGKSLGILSADVAVDGGWTRTDVTSSGGVTEHTIVGNDTCWLWYGEGRSYVTTSAEGSAADLAQRIPTYEDVLDLESEQITAADYENRSDLPCIYVEVAREELGYTEKYWISTDSGLLAAAETWKGEDLVYRMTANQVVWPLVDGQEHFVLPDGTVLHQPEG